MEQHPVDWVDPLLDTGKPHVRWVFSASACCPFGMVRLSPDTDRSGTWGTGYRYFSENIQCFSHVHGWQLSGLPVMPICGMPSQIPTPEACASRFSHDQETAQAGYHAIHLIDHNVDAELTATPRVGFHRYTFPENCENTLLFFLGADLGPSSMSDTYAAPAGNREIQGYVENAPTRRRPKPCRIHFVVRFDAPFQRFRGWQGDSFLGENVEHVQGTDTGCMLSWEDTPDNTVFMKVGISYVSVDQARLNLDTEAGDLDFDAARHQTRQLWNNRLNRIEIEGGNPDDRKKFYTDLWHTLMGGYLTSDVNGKYMDRTGQEPVVRQIPGDANDRPVYRRLEGDIFWGAHWSLSLLWQLAYPEILNDWCNTLVEMYKEGGLIPRGPSGGNYTYVMIGAHSTAFLTAAYMKGIRSFDIENAYNGMRKNAFPGGLMSKAGYEHDTCNGGGIEYYMDRGYIPESREANGGFHVDGASQTLEYAFDDWCLAEMAQALGYADDYALFSQRALNYCNLYDASTGFMRPRNKNGSWLSPFDPLSSQGWCEGNAWHYTWYVPHDIPGLSELMGGKGPCVEKLNDAFEQSTTMDFYVPRPQNINTNVPYPSPINYGNEPGRYAAHVFNHAGAPWLSQKWARRVRRQTFGKIDPAGYCEDDDNGLAAGTSVLLSLGLFDLKGGADLHPGYEVTPPFFDKITIHLEETLYDDHPFIIETQKNVAGNDYIKRATLNDQELQRLWFAHDDYAAGGRLRLELTDVPNKEPETD